jgi:transcriptional regulator GlxA family with amidase domain
MADANGKWKMAESRWQMADGKMPLKSFSVFAERFQETETYIRGMEEDQRIPMEKIDWDDVATEADYCVATASEITHWSRKSIERHFKRRWGCTPKRRFKDLRGAQMKHDVQALGPAIAATKWGQHDLSHFRRMYTEAHGYSPRHENRPDQ